MANTAAIVFASPHRLTFLLTGDGTQAGPTVTNATMLAALPDGPLKQVLSASYATQAAMRTALFTGAPCRVVTHLHTVVNDVTAEKNQVSVDTDTDAVTTTAPELNFSMSDTTGQIGYATLEYLPPEVR